MGHFTAYALNQNIILIAHFYKKEVRQQWNEEKTNEEASPGKWVNVFSFYYSNILSMPARISLIRGNSKTNEERRRRVVIDSHKTGFLFN